MVLHRLVNHFFGPDILKHYRYKESFEREFASEGRDIDCRKRFIHIERNCDYIANVVVPNIASSLGIYAAVAMDDLSPLVFSGISEVVRLHTRAGFRRAVNRYESIRDGKIKSLRLRENIPDELIDEYGLD